jgi:Xaa-Pro aminopeptidase
MTLHDGPRRRIVILAMAAACILASTSCARVEPPASRARSEQITRLADALRQGDPWPAIREERLRSLLPQKMEAAGIDAWILFCRENNNDPLAKHVGCENAGRFAAVLFLRHGSTVRRIVVASDTETEAYHDALPQAEILPAKDEAAVFAAVAENLQRASPAAIAVNKSELAAADGLTATEQDTLRAAIGPDLSRRLRSSEPLVVGWLALKLPAEVDIMRRAGALTSLLEYEAIDEIVPGKTTNGDLQQRMRARVEQLGFKHAWPDNPGITSGLDRGRGSDPARVIVPGDVIDIDFGIKVFDTWCTDVQRFAYILRAGETAPPKEVQYAWESASQSSRRMRAAMRPGIAGREVDKVQGDWMRERGSLGHPFRTGHPVGYWAHDLGPSLSGYRKEAPPKDSERTLEAGMVFAFDGDYVWTASDGTRTGTRSITSEEMAVITPGGAEYLTPIQENLVLIPSRR